MTFNNKILYVLFILLFFLWVLMLINTQEESSREIPVRFAEIPQQTIDYLLNLINQGGDVGIQFNPDPEPSGWSDSLNAGEEPYLAYSKIGDKNFIIYYKDSWREKKKASIALRIANSAIKPLEELFGVYYYPSDVNNRKLVIYLAATREDFNLLYFKLCNVNPQENTIGAASFELSRLGWLTKGLIIAPEPWERGGLAFQKVIWHEMAHYIYFTSIDVTKGINPFPWISEGIAEFFSKNETRLQEIDLYKLNSIHLNHKLSSNSDSYWVGYTVFLYMDSYFHKQGVTRFIQSSYSNKPSKLVPMVLNMNMELFEKRWRRFVRTVSK